LKYRLEELNREKKDRDLKKSTEGNKTPEIRERERERERERKWKAEKT
jgi:hypothetical protein